ncbi:hypothetical protein CR513_54685, partial [Mucuna pruriens]
MKFNTQYLTSRPHHLTPMALVNLRQGENESLWHGSQTSRSFSDSLCRDLPTSMDELRMRVISYIQMEEMIEFPDSVCVGQSSAPHNTKEHGHFG